VGFLADKVALEEVFSEYFGFLCQFLFHRLLHIHHHLSSGAGVVGQLVAEVPNGHSLIPHQETKKKKITNLTYCNTMKRITFSSYAVIVRLLQLPVSNDLENDRYQLSLPTSSYCNKFAPAVCIK
jgi:hypothetical protein